MVIDYYCYDGDPLNDVPPHRPSTEDLGGDGLQDFPGEPVNPLHGISGKAENQRNQVGSRLTRTAATMRCSIRFSTGDPFVYKSVQLRTVAVDLVLTDNDVGDTTISWPIDSFPVEMTEPSVSINGDAPGMVAIESIANGVRVRTYDASGDPADLPFTFSIH